MATTFEPTVFLAFIAGVLTVTTPCCLPMLPPLFAGSVGSRVKPFFIVLGAVVSFTLMGGLFAALGLVVGGFGEILRFVASWVIIAFGAIMVDDELHDAFTRWTTRLINPLSGFFDRRYALSKTHPFLGAFLLGLSLGVLWIPCIGPILGAILTLAVYEGNLYQGSFLLLVYSLGFGLSLLVVAYGGKRISGRVEWTRRNSQLLYKAGGWILILVGVAILLGLYNYLQVYLYPYAVYLEEWFLPS
jgi:cytochrome c biogenesis protein CcdA